MASEEDPLVKALPPATDYLTYLTILEYQLTPTRLPILHQLLQDETLTTNIGWDLVQLLLPMLPPSQECLQDIARLGNPREVILRVSDSLMKLEPGDEDSQFDEEEEEEEEATTGSAQTHLQLSPEHATTTADSSSQTPTLPRHVIQFNCLIAMLSVLHGRIKTQRPSRFIATSLHAALEAYGSMPTDETTNALLEFLRDLSPTKRPALPPRGTSGSSVVRATQASAPDPEAAYDEPAASDDAEIQLRLIQFALIELMKSYLLSLSTVESSGVSWALRVQERLNPKERQLADKLSKNDLHAETEHLKERDLIVGRICALSRDLGIKDEDLLQIVSSPPDTHPPPLDFEELPKTAEEIPLERHGALLLLAARLSASILFSGPATAQVPVYPDLAVVFSNFVGAAGTADEAAQEQPQALHDALLAITALSSHDKAPVNEDQYGDLVLAVTACSSRQIYRTLRKIPLTIFRTHPSETARFKLIRKIFEKEEYLYARESAVGWLQEEILSTTTETSNHSVFLNPHYFSVLFSTIFNPVELESLDLSSPEIGGAWLRFSLKLAFYYHAALSLYYLLLSSAQLRDKLELAKTYQFFAAKFLPRLKSTCRTFEGDLLRNGGDGQIEAAVGEDMCYAGMARSIGVLHQITEQVEEKLADLLANDEETMSKQASAADIAEVERIRDATSV